MAKYRKKPVVIEAFLWAGGLDYVGWPDWIMEAIHSGTIVEYRNFLSVYSLEGTIRAAPGDWIIRGVKGEIYSCKPDIFDATYEKVE